MNEATRAKRRNLTQAISEYRLKSPGHSEAGKKVLLREIAEAYGVTQKSIREGA